MNEKILVKSERCNFKRLIAVCCLIGLIIGLIVSTVLYFDNSRMLKSVNYDLKEWTADYKENHFDYSYERMELYKDIRNAIWGKILLPTVLCLAGMAIVGVVLYVAWSRIELVVSSKRVFGKTVFGNRVDLPIDSISAIGSKWPKGIAVATSSGKIAFLMIKNRDEIHKCVSDMLIERQNKSIVTSAPIVEQDASVSNADELKKYKELLDLGVITQEEFEAKKKQLLGL